MKFVSVFKFFANWLDSSQHDAALEKHIGPVFGQVRGLLGLGLLCVLLTAVATVSLWVIDAKTPPPEYLAATSKGVETPLPLLNEPVFSASKVTDWTMQALKDTFSFNFVDINNQLDNSRAYFTPSGWAAFNTALVLSKVVENVQKNRLDVWLTPLGEARIIGSCTSSQCKYLYWRIEVPVIVTYTGAAPQAARKQLITLLVLRVPTTDNPNGLGIAQLSAAGMQ